MDAAAQDRRHHDRQHEHAQVPDGRPPRVRRAMTKRYGEAALVCFLPRSGAAVLGRMAAPEPAGRAMLLTELLAPRPAGNYQVATPRPTPSPHNSPAESGMRLRLPVGTGRPLALALVGSGPRCGATTSTPPSQRQPESGACRRLGRKGRPLPVPRKTLLRLEAPRVADMALAAAPRPGFRRRPATPPPHADAAAGSPSLRPPRLATRTQARKILATSSTARAASGRRAALGLQQPRPQPPEPVSRSPRTGRRRRGPA